MTGRQPLENNLASGPSGIVPSDCIASAFGRSRSFFAVGSMRSTEGSFATAVAGRTSGV